MVIKELRAIFLSQGLVMLSYPAAGLAQSLVGGRMPGACCCLLLWAKFTPGSSAGKLLTTLSASSIVLRACRSDTASVCGRQSLLAVQYHMVHVPATSDRANLPFLGTVTVV